MGIFSLDGKLARFLNKLGDLIILNILTIVCCIPIITIGASFTALYTVTLKMAKNEEGKVAANFFDAFRENFKQSTILWLISGGIMAFLAFDVYLCRYINGDLGKVYQGILIAVMVLIATMIMYLFPVLARFSNTTKATAKNAVLFCLSHFFKSILMLVVCLLPFVLLAVSMRFVSVIVLVGIAGPAFLTSIYYRSVFRPFETGAIQSN